MSKLKPQTPKGGWYRVLEGVLRQPIMGLTKRDWRGGEYLQRDGGIVLAMNHLSWFDPFVAAHFANDNGRPARFLAKSEIFKIPGLGNILKGSGQIPVHRGSTEAASSLHSAVDAVRKGECVIVYPEGTLTRDRNLWPMTAKTGAARIALTTGAPVIPAAQWGPQDILPPYSKSFKPLPRKTMHVWAGPEVNLDDLRAMPITSATLREATERIMAAITALLSEIREEPAPIAPLDRRTALKNTKLDPEKGSGQ